MSKIIQASFLCNKFFKIVKIFKYTLYNRYVTIVTSKICGCGGIGRHVWFRPICASMQVQVLSPAPFVGDKTTQCHSMVITEGCVQAKVLSTSVSLEVDRL